MATIVRCTNCGDEYRRTEEKFLVPHTGSADCTVCGDTLESWVENTHVAIFELVKRPDGTAGWCRDLSAPRCEFAMTLALMRRIGRNVRHLCRGIAGGSIRGCRKAGSP